MLLDSVFIGLLVIEYYEKSPVKLKPYRAKKYLPEVLQSRTKA